MIPFKTHMGQRDPSIATEWQRCLGHHLAEGNSWVTCGSPLLNMFGKGLGQKLGPNKYEGPGLQQIEKTSTEKGPGTRSHRCTCGQSIQFHDPLHLAPGAMEDT